MGFNPAKAIRRAFCGLKKFEFVFPTKGGMECVMPMLDRLYDGGVLYEDIVWRVRIRTGDFGETLEKYCHIVYWAKNKVLDMEKFEDSVARNVYSDLVNLNERMSEFEERMKLFGDRMDSMYGKK